MNRYLNYEAEIVEDIPEQFDLSRYKKPSNIKPSSLNITYSGFRSPMETSKFLEPSHNHQNTPNQSQTYPYSNFLIY